VESVRLQRWYHTESNPLKKAYLGLQWPKLKTYERRILDEFDACVVVSETDRDLLKSMGVKTRFHVVPNGTNTEFFRPMGRPKVENSVLWIGHMDVHTNKDAVLYFWREIYPLLRQKCPAVSVSFVGTAPPEEIARTSKVDSHVRVTGFVDDVRPYVDEAAVIVIPIRIGSGTRLKILDCMAMGKAIVSTSVGCEGLNVTDGKDIVMADAPQFFADRISELLKDQGKRENIQRNARKRALTYDWKNLIRLQEETYSFAARRRIIMISNEARRIS
jgi:glycosyltransferase involved in cell wall biosynthesis